MRAIDAIILTICIIPTASLALAVYPWVAGMLVFMDMTHKNPLGAVLMAWWFLSPLALWGWHMHISESPND